MDRPQLSKSERKNMDTCLRRLKQELLSMKEAGDGLHAQMNSMMGALQELKLLQVQTALDQLDISSRPVSGAPAPAPPPPAAPETSVPVPSRQTPSPRPSLVRTPSRESQRQSWVEQHQSSLETSTSSSSLESESLGSVHTDPPPDPHVDPWPLPLPRRVSGYTAPQVDFCGPRLSHPPQLQTAPQVSAKVVDLPGILYSLSREGPSLDSDYSQDSMDDSSDWTSSLMSRSRNRQPLVLGDNVFADLVGNWLDLPELERDDGAEPGEADGVDRPDSPAHPLRLSRSQEICRKFSLTTNIFKKFLRSVRPDRDKLLKERPGWMAPEQNPDGDLFKRPRKAPASKARPSFYLPFWAAGAPQGKGRPGPPLAPEAEPHRPPFSGIYIDRRLAEGRVERMQPLFDYNTAVWV